MNSRQPRKQRKDLYTAPLHRRRKRLAAHLAEDLIVRYNKRSLPVVQGDTVRVLRGDFKNHTDKVRHVNPKGQTIEVEGVVTTKVDGSKVPRPVHPSNVVITKLNLTDPWRRERLERGLSEEVKREIEKEAQQQIIEEQREAQRRAEEEAAAAAAAEVEEAEAESPDEEAPEELPEAMSDEEAEEEDVEEKEAVESEEVEEAPETEEASGQEEGEEEKEAPLEEETPTETTEKKSRSRPKDLSKENVEE